MNRITQFGGRFCPPRSGGARAFTLLELLIAVAIFAVLLSAINGVLYAAMRLQRKSSQSIEEALPVQQTVAKIRRDLQGIVAPGGVLCGALQPASAVNSAGGNTTTVVPQAATAGVGMGQQGGTVFYTSSGAVDDAWPWGNVQQVVYYLRDPIYRNAPGRDLVRVVNRNLLATTQVQPVEQWLMGGVERFQFSFFDGSTWQDTWDSTTPNVTTGATNNLPQAIKVQIDLAPNYGELRQAPIQLLVPIVVQARTNATQTAGAQR